jgi:hypothetical protein
MHAAHYERIGAILEALGDRVNDNSAGLTAGDMGAPAIASFPFKRCFLTHIFCIHRPGGILMWVKKP